MLDTAIAMLREQQSKVDTWSPVHMVAEQLIEICRNEPASADLIEKDLANPSMSIVEAEKKIHAIADEHAPKGRNGGVGVSPLEAEKALRKFYGLPERGASPVQAGGITTDYMDLLR